MSFRKGKKRQRLEGGVGWESLGGTGGGVSGSPSLRRTGIGGSVGESESPISVGGTSVVDSRVEFSDPCVAGREERRPSSCARSMVSIDLVWMGIRGGLGMFNDSGRFAIFGFVSGRLK